jgi:hypothetical protein
MHGGLVFYNTNLLPVHEWPEPGIVDFVLQGSTVSILSHRGVIANVTFDSNYKAWLHAASRAVPDNPLAAPCQGLPLDLELIKLNLGSAVPMLVSLWTGDTDKLAARIHLPDNLDRIYSSTVLTSLRQYEVTTGKGRPQLATCKENITSPVGEHLLALVNDNLVLFDQYGSHQASKCVFQFAGPQGAEFYSPGYGCVGLAVGDLIPGAPASGYSEEVVVATEGGHLVWMHVQDIADPGSYLPAASYTAATARAGAPAAGVQPRTNRALSATWAMARKPGDQYLHVLDAQGGYWRVDGGSSTVPASAVLWEREQGVAEARGWAHAGPVDGFTPVLETNRLLLPSGVGEFEHPSAGQLGPHGTTFYFTPDCPMDTFNVIFEYGTPGYFPMNNWAHGLSPFGVFEDFTVFLWGGSVIPGDPFETWSWSQNHKPQFEPWANLVVGLRVDLDPLVSTGTVDGFWASTGVPYSGPNSTTPLHDLRNVQQLSPPMNHQALVAVRLAGSGQTVVVLGCPGGRVRVLSATDWETDTSSPHVLGAMHSSPDQGFGGAALAVRQDPGDQLTIWLGTHYAPTALPANYTSPTGVLGNTEVAAGSVTKFVWTTAGLSPPQATKTFYPGGAHVRGGYDVVGLLVTDILPDPPNQEELIVATLSGDLIVLEADTLDHIWGTHVPGAIGCFNSLLAEDLDGDLEKELYVAGSRGLWRFVLPGEHQ